MTDTTPSSTIVPRTIPSDTLGVVCQTYYPYGAWRTTPMVPETIGYSATRTRVVTATRGS